MDAERICDCKKFGVVHYEKSSQRPDGTWQSKCVECGSVRTYDASVSLEMTAKQAAKLFPIQ